METLLSREILLFKTEDYEKNFDPKFYFERYYKREVHEEPTILEELAESVWKTLKKEYSPEFQGTALDFGCGPVPLYCMFISSIMTDIVCADPVTGNRQELIKWWNGDEDAFDWSPQLHFSGKLINKSPEETAKQCRNSIKEIIFCDLKAEKIIEDTKYSPYDLINAAFCLPYGCNDHQSYKIAVKKLAATLKPGGLLTLLGTLGEKKYQAGESATFLSLTQQKSDVEDALKFAGFNIIKWRTNEKQEKFSYLPVKFDSLFSVIARKVL